MSVTRSNDVETDGMMLCSVWLWHRVGLKQVPRNIKNYPLPWHVYHQSSIRKSMMMIAIIIITIDSRILFSKYISKYLGTWDLKFPLHCCNSADFVPNQNVLNNTKLKQYPQKKHGKNKKKPWGILTCKKTCRQRLCIRSDPSGCLLKFKDDIKKTFNRGEKLCISQLHS